jgi:hypothetical protein
VVGICGAAHLERCLAGLARQRGAPPFEVVVAYDPRLPQVAGLALRHPRVRLIANQDERTPVELAARAVHECRGEIVLLTEDHCIPRPDWVRRLCDGLLSGRGAVGGVIEPEAAASPAEWAFWFTDYYRYARPAVPGPSPSLSICNVAYRRRELALVAPSANRFVEPAVHDALRRRFGPLWMVPEAEVTTTRSVRLRDAVKERYAFGRLFGSARIEGSAPSRRLLLAAAAPGLPLLLLARLTAKALGDERHARRFYRAFPQLVLLVLAWSWGEWLGYVTARGPRSLAAAPDARAAAGTAAPGDSAAQAAG